MVEIEIVKTGSNGVTFEEALKLVPKGRRMLSNKEADEILQNEGLYKKNRNLFDCYTGTILIHEEQGKPFREFVKDSETGWLFDVPKEFQGSKDCGLVMQHPQYEFKTGSYDMAFIVPKKSAKIRLLEDFPGSSGWHEVDEETGIPCGKSSSSKNKDARYLYRVSAAAIRPLVRWDDDLLYDRRGVDADWWPNVRRGVGVVVNAAKEE